MHGKEINEFHAYLENNFFVYRKQYISVNADNFTKVWDYIIMFQVNIK